MFDPAQLDQVLGQPLFDAHGFQVGLIGQVYLHPDTAAPQWVTVHTGKPSTTGLFVPLAGATGVGAGLGVPYSTDTVLTAPCADAETAVLSPAHVAQLHRHYGPQTGQGHPLPGPTDHQDQQDNNAALASGDDGMTRSEEQLKIVTETFPTETVRLRKHIITEEKTITVSVRREVISVDRVPITDSDARSGGGLTAELSQARYQMVLYEEQIVVDKKIVPVERVTLITDLITEQHEITDQVRTEQIDTDTTGGGVLDTLPNTTHR